VEPIISGMRRFDRILSNIVFSLCILLLMAAIFQPQIEAPGWLLAGGKLHPILLHFPSAVLLLLLLAIPFRNRWMTVPQFQDIFGRILLMTSFVTVLTALSGLFLSLGDGYDQVLLTRHLWLGTFTAVLSYVIWQLWVSQTSRSTLINFSAIIGALLFFIQTGAFVAGIGALSFVSGPLLAGLLFGGVATLFLGYFIQYHANPNAPGNEPSRGRTGWESSGGPIM
jgi:hypothetical protein